MSPDPPSLPPSPPAEPTAALSRASLGRVLAAVLGVYLGLKLLLLALFAWNTQLVMDEYSQAAYSVHIPDGFYRVVDPVKTVLSVYLFEIARELSTTSVGLLRIARLETLALALGMVLLVYLIGRNLGSTRTEGLFSAAVLLAFSTFMERSFRVRSDTVAVFFALAALWAVTRKSSGRLGWVFAGGLLTGAAFLATQKAAYYFLAFGVAYLGAWVVRWVRYGKPFSGLLPGMVFGAGWVVSLLAYGVYFGGGDFARVIRMVFTSPLQGALHADEYYTHFRAYLPQTLNRNQVAYGLCLAGILVAVGGWRRLTEAQGISLAVTLVISLFLLFHNQPWPYVYVMALPFLALWSPEGVRRLVAEEERQVKVYLFLLVLLSLSFARNLPYLERGNRQQLEVTAQAESLLAPDDLYADGIAMVPGRRVVREAEWWDAMESSRLRQEAAQGNLESYRALFAAQPKVWILSYRIRGLSRELAPWLKDAYVRVYPNVMLAGVEIPAEGAGRFFAYWPGRYRLYGANGEPILGEPFLLDGREVAGEVEVGVGEHQVARKEGLGDRHLFLLPADVELPGPLPAVGLPAELFEAVYD